MLTNYTFSKLNDQHQLETIASILGIPRGSEKESPLNAYKKELEEIRDYMLSKISKGKFKNRLDDTTEAIRKEVREALKINELKDSSRIITKVEVLKEYFAFRHRVDERLTDFEKHTEEFKENSDTTDL